MAMQFTGSNFETEVYQADVPVLVDFMRTGAVHAKPWDRWWKRWRRNMREK